MSEERYIAAIEISSSKIIAAVGKTVGEGRIEVIAVEHEKAVDAVRYGIIQNLEETSVRAGRIIDRLQRRTGVAPRLIKGLFVGLSGRSLRSITKSFSLNLPEGTEITDEIIERLRVQADHPSLERTLEVVDAVPRLYRIGNTETNSPKGNIGNSIEANYDIIVCRPELKRNILRTIPDKLGIRIEGFVVTPLATAHLILTTDEKRLGCMLVDMGAETTTVSIYRKGSLGYFETLPLGGRNITRDLTSQNMLEETAEDLKITSGSAIPPAITSNPKLEGIRHSDISTIVVARAEEIVANIVEQIQYAGLKDTDLRGGIVCIGGGSRLQGIMELLEKQSNLPVRRGKLPDYVELATVEPGCEIDEVVSIMYAGATLSNHECLEEPPRQELPATGELPAEEPQEETLKKRPKKRRDDDDTEPRNGIFSRLGKKIANIFGDPSDNSELID